MPEWLEALLTIYGPLGLGWILLYFLWERYKALQDRHEQTLIKAMDLAESNNKTLESVLNVLDRLEASWGNIKPKPPPRRGG